MLTHRLVSLLGLLMSLWSVTACKNPRFCAGNPEDDCTLRVDASGVTMCTQDNDCSAPIGVCDLGGTMTCVECTTSKPDVCIGMKPVCVSNQCQKCTAHAQCAASNVCLPDGSCADEAQVAYVQAGGVGTTCTKTAPCGTLDVGLKTNKPFVKISAGTVADSNMTTIDGKTVTVFAEPGAKLDRTGDGIILEVKNNGADVQIFDLEITGGTGVGDAAISLPNGGAPKLTLTRVKVDVNQGLGILSAAGTLTVIQSTVSENTGGGISCTGGTLVVSQSTVSGNTGGGISVGTPGQFLVVGNVFFGNGSGSSAVGAVSISTSQSATNRLDFNSFSKNQTQDGVGSAVQCIAGAFTARNNIMSGNGTQTNLEQVGGTCVHAYSIAQPGTLPGGTGNKADDPLFKNTITGDLHILPGSPAAGAADPGSDLTGVAAHDIDGDVRMNPADIGADEIP